MHGNSHYTHEFYIKQLASLFIIKFRSSSQALNGNQKSKALPRSNTCIIKTSKAIMCDPCRWSVCTGLTALGEM